MITPVLSTATAAGATKAAADPKLASAAKQFETVLLGQWLQDAESSFAAVPGGADDTDAGGEQMQGFATQQLATSFAAQGGVGIAKLVLGALQKADGKEHTPLQQTTPTTAQTVPTSSLTNAMAAYRAEGSR